MDKIVAKQVFLSSLLITVIIFGAGFIFNYELDSLRYGQVKDSIQENELKLSAFLVEEGFINEIGGDKCVLLKHRISSVAEDTRQYGLDLVRYQGKTGLLKTRFDLLKREYSLSEIELYHLIQDYNQECGTAVYPIIFFYEINDETSTKQGLILDDLVSRAPVNVTVLSFDIEYDEEPALQIFKDQLNIISAPTVIVSNTTFTDTVYVGQIKDLIINQ